MGCDGEKAEACCMRISLHRLRGETLSIAAENHHIEGILARQPNHVNLVDACSLLTYRVAREYGHIDRVR